MSGLVVFHGHPGNDIGIYPRRRNVLRRWAASPLGAMFRGGPQDRALQSFLPRRFVQALYGHDLISKVFLECLKQGREDVPRCDADMMTMPQIADGLEHVL